MANTLPTSFWKKIPLVLQIASDYESMDHTQSHLMSFISDANVLALHRLLWNHQGRKLLSCSHCQGLGQQASWLLIGFSSVNDQSEARSASWPNSWHDYLQLISFHPRKRLATTCPPVGTTRPWDGVPLTRWPPSWPTWARPSTEPWIRSFFSLILPGRFVLIQKN